MLGNAHKVKIALSDATRPPSPLALAIAAELPMVRILLYLLSLRFTLQDPTVQESSQRLLESIMVAQYTVFGRQVGSHVVSLLYLFHASTPPFFRISIPLIKQLTLVTVTARNAHPGHICRRNDTRYGREREGEGARATNQCWLEGRRGIYTVRPLPLKYDSRHGTLLKLYAESF